MTTTEPRTLTATEYGRAIELCQQAWKTATYPTPRGSNQDRVRRARRTLDQLRNLLGLPAVTDILQRTVQPDGVLSPSDLLFVYGLANGWTDVEMAEFFDLAPDYISYRIRSAMERVRARTRAQLVAIAAGRGELWL